MPSPYKYKKKITLQNDSVLMVGNTKAAYSPNEDIIYVKKGEMSLKDFGLSEKSSPDELLIIHERQHQINYHKGEHVVSLNESYNRNIHDEITALIAETLEIRNQYRACKTLKEQQACLEKFSHNDGTKFYINAIKSGQINPNSTSSKDFTTEMAFIKDHTTHFRADPSDNGYRQQWTSVAMNNLSINGENARPNPEGFAEDVKKMYQIGGFDFNTVGTKELILIKNQSIIAADNMLKEGANPKKLLRFMNEEEGPFTLAEKLDVSGLSQEQAEKVIETAILSQSLAENLSTDLILGETPSYDYNFINNELRSKTALYLDLKSDIWAKRGTLTPNGDEEKFNRLMQEAQIVTLTPKTNEHELEWRIKHRTPPFSAEEIKAIKEKAASMQGQKVNINDVVSNIDEKTLPLEGTSVAEVIEEINKKEEEERKIWEEYNKEHPEEKHYSAPYEAEITDFSSNLLKDELQARKEEENKIEPLHTPKGIKTYAPYGDGLMVEIKNPEYTNAELLHLSADNGTTKDVAMIDGKKHGAEITRDATGKITDIKVYDHGKEIDLSKNKLEYHLDEKNGIKREYIELNGEIFGSEILTDQNGKTKAAFYDRYGMEIAGAASSTIKKKENTLELPQAPHESLKEELLAQKGNLENQNTTVLSRSQALRFDFKLEEYKAATSLPLSEVSGRREKQTETPPIIIQNKNHTR